MARRTFAEHQGPNVVRRNARAAFSVAERREMPDQRIVLKESCELTAARCVACRAGRGRGGSARRRHQHERDRRCEQRDHGDPRGRQCVGERGSSHHHHRQRGFDSLGEGRACPIRAAGKLGMTLTPAVRDGKTAAVDFPSIPRSGLALLGLRALSYDYRPGRLDGCQKVRLALAGRLFSEAGHSWDSLRGEFL